MQTSTMASETLRSSGAMSLGGTGRVGGGTTTFSALGDDMPNLPHFRKNKQVARPRLHNFSGANGTVYEKHWKPAEVDHLGGLVHRAEAIRGISTKEKEAIAQRKAAAAAARAGSMDYQSNLTEIPVDVQTEKQVRGVVGAVPPHSGSCRGDMVARQVQTARVLPPLAGSACFCILPGGSAREP